MAAMRRLLLLLALLAPALADEVLLRGGTRLNGVVLARGDAEVRLLLPLGEEITLLSADVAEVVADPDAPREGEWIRFVDLGEKGARLQVALAHLLPAGAGPRVDLLGAVHIADGAFWRDVQRLAETSDAVLYEMVKPKEARPEAMAEADNPIRRLQLKVAKWFDLKFQIEALDYGRPHFVHADLTVEELGGGAGEGETRENAGGSASLPGELAKLEPLLKMAEPALEKMMGADGDPQARAVRLRFKRMVASALGIAGNHAAMLVGPALSELLITRRNAVVVRRLAELEKSTRSALVLYGAGHMRELERALVAEGGYRRAGGRWLTAWEIPAP